MMKTIFYTAMIWMLSALPALASYGEGSGSGAPAQGQPGQGFGLVRALIMIIFLLVIFRFFRRRGGGGPMNRPGPMQRPGPFDGNGGNGNGDDEVTPRRAADRYTRAQQTWDFLSSEGENTTPTGTPPPVPNNAPAGFDAVEFIEGAKAMYARLRRSCDERNYDDLRQFTTMPGFDALKRRADNTPSGTVTHVLLLDADLGDIGTGDGRVTAAVHYQATLADQKGEQKQVRETWTFVKDDRDPKAMWKLDGATMAS